MQSWQGPGSEDDTTGHTTQNSLSFSSPPPHTRKIQTSSKNKDPRQQPQAMTSISRDNLAPMDTSLMMMGGAPQDNLAPQSQPLYGLVQGAINAQHRQNILADQERLLNAPTMPMNNMGIAQSPSAAQAFQLDGVWQMLLARLARFKSTHGHCRVPALYPPDPILGEWVSLQRRRYHAMLKKVSAPQTVTGGSVGMNLLQQEPPLTAQQLADLSALGFFESAAETTSAPKLPSAAALSQSEFDAAWSERYIELRNYKMMHGDCLVPARYGPNPRLGHWVMTQRRQYALLKQGRPSSMTWDRVQKLGLLEFAWQVRAEPKQMWNQRYDELKAYKGIHGDCLVPQRYASNPKLGTWVNTQRRHYKLMVEGKRSSMTKERVEALNKLDFVWSTSNNADKDSKKEDQYQE